MCHKLPNVRISANFFPKLGFYKDSKKLLRNIYGDNENTFGAYVGILSGLQKKKNRILSGLQKPRKMAMGFYMDSKKTHQKVVWGFRFFFPGFFGILQDSDTYFGHICSSVGKGGCKFTTYLKMNLKITMLLRLVFLAQMWNYCARPAAQIWISFTRRQTDTIAHVSNFKKMTRCL